MTEYYSFVPQPNGPFVFYPTLDGVSYTASVTWNLSGQRYYVSLFSSEGSRVLTLPMLGSVEALQVEEASWDESLVTITTELPHGLVLGTMIQATFRGFAPVTFNGKKLLLVTGDYTFTYDQSENPGKPTALGTASQEVDIAGGYFSRSTLVFRQKNQQFEVNP